jgi:LuxR family maltose regulon positive regulatory protein
MAILRTKLNIPRIYSDLLERPRLTARLNEGVQNKLVLVSAPAGFGKTTLLSSWAAKAAMPVMWLSLDERDNDPVRFWSYFVAALRTLVFGDDSRTNGDTAIGMLQSQQAPPIESILTELINDISAYSRDFVLVLDDNHPILCIKE